MTLPKYVLIVGLLMTAFFGLCTFMIIITPTSVNQTATWQIALFFGLFTLWGMCTVWSYVICRHAYDDHGLTYTTLFNQKKFLAWHAIDDINYSVILRCGILISKSGEKFYISDNMIGLGDFIQTLSDKASTD